MSGTMRRDLREWRDGSDHRLMGALSTAGKDSSYDVYQSPG